MPRQQLANYGESDDAEMTPACWNRDLQLAESKPAQSTWVCNLWGYRVIASDI